MHLTIALHRPCRALSQRLHSWFAPALHFKRAPVPGAGPERGRRAFIRALLVATAAAHARPAAAAFSRLLPRPAVEPASANGQLEAWSLAAFEGLKGTCFLVDGQQLLLDQVEGHSRDGLETISLRFRGRARGQLEGQLHRFQHPAHPAIDLFAVPGTASRGGQYYRVIICRFTLQRPGLLSRGEGWRLSSWSRRPETTPI